MVLLLVLAMVLVLLQCWYCTLSQPSGPHQHGARVDCIQAAPVTLHAFEELLQ